jgi:hypothetical protein
MVMMFGEFILNDDFLFFLNSKTLNQRSLILIFSKKSELALKKIQINNYLIFSLKYKIIPDL